MRRLAKNEAGFGLIELLIAMSVMVIAIMAIVAAFSSGMVALNRASQASTAATLADSKMESFRRMAYTSPTFAPTCANGTSAATDCFSSVTVPPPPTPDKRTYRIDTAVRFDCVDGPPSGTVGSATCPSIGTPRLKRVTVVVYDPTTTPVKELFRETSTFDQATG